MKLMAVSCDGRSCCKRPHKFDAIESQASVRNDTLDLHPQWHFWYVLKQYSFLISPILFHQPRALHVRKWDVSAPGGPYAPSATANF